MLICSGYQLMPLISVHIKAVPVQQVAAINVLLKVWVVTAQKYTWQLIRMVIQLNLLLLMVLRTTSKLRLHYLGF